MNGMTGRIAYFAFPKPEYALPKELQRHGSVH